MSARITRVIDIDCNARVEDNDGLVIQDQNQSYVVNVRDYLQGHTQFDTDLTASRRLSKIYEASGGLRLVPSLFDRTGEVGAEANNGLNCQQLGLASPCDCWDYLRLLLELWALLHPWSSPPWNDPYWGFSPPPRDPDYMRPVPLPGRPMPRDECPFPGDWHFLPLPIYPDRIRPAPFFNFPSTP